MFAHAVSVTVKNKKCSKPMFSERTWGPHKTSQGAIWGLSGAGKDPWSVQQLLNTWCWPGPLPAGTFSLSANLPQFTSFFFMLKKLLGPLWELFFFIFALLIWVNYSGLLFRVLYFVSFAFRVHVSAPYRTYVPY